MKKGISSAVALMAGVGALNSANIRHNGIYAAQNSDFTNAYPDAEQLDAYLNSCPASDAELALFEHFTNIEVPRSFKYKTITGNVMTEIDDSDIRAVNGLYKFIKFDPGDLVKEETVDKGLATVIDRGLIKGGDAGLEKAIRLKARALRQRLSRIEYLRMVTAGFLGATKVDAVWGPGSNPDLDMQSIVDGLECPPNRALMGRGVRPIRRAVYEQPTLVNAALAMHAGYSDQELADNIGVTEIIRESLKFQTGTKTPKNYKLGNDVLFYNSGQEIFDSEEFDGLVNPVSLARFWSPADQDALSDNRWGVIVEERQRLIVVAVFHYSKVAVVNQESLVHLRVTAA